MTVSTTSARVAYTGDAGTTVFSVPFYFIDSGDLAVYLTVSGTTTEQTETTHYTVSGAGNEAGGSVTMLSAPASGATLTIIREPEQVQTTDYQANDPFPAETHEAALDKQMMVSQHLQDQIDRAILLPVETSGVDGGLPTPEAGKSIVWNDDADGLENGPTVSDIENAEANAIAAAASAAAAASYAPYADRATAAAATISDDVSTILVLHDIQTLRYMQTDSGESYPALTTADGKKWIPDGEITPLHFGAAGDGVTDDATAIQTAINYTTNANAPLVIPEGTFLVNTGLTVDTDNHHIIGKGCGGFSSEINKQAASVIKAGAAMDAIITYLEPTLTGSNAGNRIEGVKLVGESLATRGLWFQDNNNQPVIADVKVIACDTCIRLDTSCWGPRFTRVMVDFRDIGFELRENNHNAVFEGCVTRSSTSGTVGVRIGYVGSSSNINFYGCDFEADEASTAQVQVFQGRAIGFFGCYLEGRDGTSGASGIALGRSDGSEYVEGVIIHGCYFQGLDTGDRAILMNAVRGIHIAASHFRSWVVRAFTTADEANVRGVHIDPSVSLGGTITESDGNTYRAAAGVNYLTQALAITADLGDGPNLYLETPTDYASPIVISATYSPRINGEVTLNCLNTSAGSNDIDFDSSNFISAGTVTLAAGERGVVRFVQDGGTNKLVEHSRSIY